MWWFLHEYTYMVDALLLISWCVMVLFTSSITTYFLLQLVQTTVQARHCCHTHFDNKGGQACLFNFRCMTEWWFHQFLSKALEKVWCKVIYGPNFFFLLLFKRETVAWRVILLERQPTKQGKFSSAWREDLMEYTEIMETGLWDINNIRNMEGGAI